ncbi:hypothetical protein PG997_002033 [Apiospora hydei]|uniref:Cupin type-2 domain-containing protein n=1 Tax=Apiospora hydei TaxID=1337664 RepID=A0ABR1X823_9PEZI
MREPKLLKELFIGKGLRMSLMCVEDEPVSSINRYYAEHVASGEEGDDVIDVPPHWHKIHGEYHIVLEGRLEITIDGKVIILKAGEPALYVPPKGVHSIRSFPGERMVAQERAEPPGTYKLEYFNDALSSGEFRDSKAHLVRALYDGDAYLPLAFGIKPVEEVLMWMLATVARLFAPAKPKLKIL